MIQKIHRVVLSMALLIMLSLGVKATQTGSILIQTCGGTVALYRVGSVNGQNFLLEDEYGGGVVTFEDSISPNLAAWLDGQAKTGVVKAPDIRGKVLFSNLEEGLYLVSQRSAPAGGAPFEPFLVSIPWDGVAWDLSLTPDLPEPLPVTEDSVSPIPWILGLALSGFGLIVCIEHGKQTISGKGGY